MGVRGGGMCFKHLRKKEADFTTQTSIFIVIQKLEKDTTKKIIN